MKPEIVGKRVKDFLKSRKTTTSDLAKKLGISKQTLEKKLDGQEEFLVSEVIAITKAFELDVNTVAYIFFKEEEKEEFDKETKKTIEV